MLRHTKFIKYHPHWEKYITEYSKVYTDFIAELDTYIAKIDYTQQKRNIVREVKSTSPKHLHSTLISAHYPWGAQSAAQICSNMTKSSFWKLMKSHGINIEH